MINVAYIVSVALSIISAILFFSYDYDLRLLASMICGSVATWGFFPYTHWHRTKDDMFVDW